MHTLKHLAIAAAMVGLVAPVQAEYYPGSTDFEGDSPLADACWSNVVEAAIAADASVADVPRSPNLPPSFDKTSRTNVLSFDTDAPIVRYLQSDRAAARRGRLAPPGRVEVLPMWEAVAKPCVYDVARPPRHCCKGEGALATSGFATTSRAVKDIRK